MSGIFPFATFMHDKATGLEYDHIGDYSVTPREIVYSPPDGYYFKISQSIIVIAAPGPIEAEAYGNKLPLTNGISLKFRKGVNIILDVTSDSSVKTNGDYSKFTTSTEIITFGSGVDYFKIYHDYKKPTLLDSSVEMVYTLNDDFTGLLAHTFYLTGTLVKSTPYTRRVLKESGYL